ncbi:MAG: hypothetical protein JWM47_3612 [Acidimicrobiales bacterium]|nr:hypothetical protein [Acidimicrobiales bacterium]
MTAGKNTSDQTTPDQTTPDQTTADQATAGGAAATTSTASGGAPAGTTPEARASWLAGRRWYADAGSARSGVPEEVALAAVPLPVEPPLAVGLLDTNEGARFQLLLAEPDGPDVADEPAAADRLGRWIATGGRSEEEAGIGAVVAHWPSATDRLGSAPARPLGGEQSNTSVVIGGTHVMKVFRRVRSGPHPEIEIGRHLAAVADDGTPVPVARLAGWYQFEPADGGDTTALGVVQELVPGALDAWGLVLSGLAGDPTGLLARLHELGGAVARLHHALGRPAPSTASGTGRRAEASALAPEAFGTVALPPARLADLGNALAAEAERLLATETSRAAALAPVVGRAGDVAALVEDLRAELGDDLGAAIRHHGDLHLGQVVVGAEGWVILDFEGEPTRPLGERRQRHSPLRDVAGMLRSLAYAAATSRRAEGSRLSPGWEPAARAAFLDGYLSSVDPALLPSSAATTHTLLTLLELEKVVYEIAYELAHRPDWVGLPVEGLQRFLSGARS